CLFDIVRGTRTPLAATLQGASVNGASFSPDGNMLAVLSKDGTLRLLDVTDATRPTIRLARTIPGSMDVTFIDHGVLALAVDGGMEFVRTTGESERLALADINRWATSASNHELVLGLRGGGAAVVDSFSSHIVARADLCPGPIARLQYIPGRRTIVYACWEGPVGIWDVQ